MFLKTCSICKILNSFVSDSFPNAKVEGSKNQTSEKSFQNDHLSALQLFRITCDMGCQKRFRILGFPSTSIYHHYIVQSLLVKKRRQQLAEAAKLNVGENVPIPFHPPISVPISVFLLDLEAV